MEKHLPALQVMELGYTNMIDQRVGRFFGSKTNDFIEINQPTRCINLSDLLPVI
jgi:hypothetical protein